MFESTEWRHNGLAICIGGLLDPSTRFFRFCPTFLALLIFKISAAGVDVNASS